MADQPGRFLHCAPVLPVDNLLKSMRFYEDKLGFTVSFTYGEPPHYAIAKRGDEVSIHLSEREDTTQKIQPWSVYIFVTNVDAIYEEYRAKGLRMFVPPEDQEYGMREFETTDLNGHFLTFGQGIESPSRDRTE
jgi:uncharacterized glyoxalase superfamily protein PhnB